VSECALLRVKAKLRMWIWRRILFFLKFYVVFFFAQGILALRLVRSCEVLVFLRETFCTEFLDLLRMSGICYCRSIRRIKNHFLTMILVSAFSCCKAVSLFSEQRPNDGIVFSRGFALVMVNCGHYHGEKSCIA